MVAGTWLVTFSIMIPTWRGVWGRFGLDTSIGSCSILHDKYDRSPKEFLFIAAFMLPCVCIVICYARIFVLVRRAARRAGAKSSEVAVTPPIQTPSADKAKDKDKPKDKDKNKDKDKAKDQDKEHKPSTDDSGQVHPFVVSEYLAYIDDNASSESFPISYSVKQETPIDANVVLQENNLANNKPSTPGSTPAAATPTGDASIHRSLTQLEQSRNS